MHCEELEKEWKEKLAEWDKHMRGETTGHRTPVCVVFLEILTFFSLKKNSVNLELLEPWFHGDSQ